MHGCNSRLFRRINIRFGIGKLFLKDIRTSPRTLPNISQPRFNSQYLSARKFAPLQGRSDNKLNGDLGFIGGTQPADDVTKDLNYLKQVSDREVSDRCKETDGGGIFAARESIFVSNLSWWTCNCEGDLLWGVRDAFLTSGRKFEVPAALFARRERHGRWKSRALSQRERSKRAPSMSLTLVVFI